MSSRRDVLQIEVSLSLQQAYDEAVALAQAYAAMAAELALSGRVCPHPVSARQDVHDAADGHVTWVCTACGRTCPPAPAEEEADGGHV